MYSLKCAIFLSTFLFSRSSNVGTHAADGLTLRLKQSSYWGQLSLRL